MRKERSREISRITLRHVAAVSPFLKKKFSAGDIRGMKKTAALCAADRNPYSRNMDFLPYADGSGYEARFTKCGICALTGELGLAEFIPAMCRLDYDMAESGGTFDFIREYTLAAGGPCCDCGYKRKSNRSIRKE